MRERIGADGEIVEPLHEADVREAVLFLRAEEMLRFWSVDALEHWTRRRCPAADKILPALTKRRL